VYCGWGRKRRGDIEPVLVVEMEMEIAEDWK